MENYRKDLGLITDLVKKNSKVLDIGCGDGELLNLLEISENEELNYFNIQRFIKKLCCFMWIAEIH